MTYISVIIWHQYKPEWFYFLFYYQACVRGMSWEIVMYSVQKHRPFVTCHLPLAFIGIDNRQFYPYTINCSARLIHFKRLDKRSSSYIELHLLLHVRLIPLQKYSSVNLNRLQVLNLSQYLVMNLPGYLVFHDICTARVSMNFGYQTLICSMTKTNISSKKTIQNLRTLLISKQSKW